MVRRAQKQRCCCCCCCCCYCMCSPSRRRRCPLPHPLPHHHRHHFQHPQTTAKRRITTSVTRHTSHVTCVLASLAAATTSQAFSDATSSACTCARCQTPKRPIFTVQETLSTHIIQRDLPVAALDDAAENPQSRPLCRALAQETK